MALDSNGRIKKGKRNGKRFEFELEPGKRKVEVVEALRTKLHQRMGKDSGRENDRTCIKIKRRLICAVNG